MLKIVEEELPEGFQFSLCVKGHTILYVRRGSTYDICEEAGAVVYSDSELIAPDAAASDQSNADLIPAVEY